MPSVVPNQWQGEAAWSWTMLSRSLRAALMGSIISSGYALVAMQKNPGAKQRGGLVGVWRAAGCMTGLLPATPA